MSVSATSAIAWSTFAVGRTGARSAAALAAAVSLFSQPVEGDQWSRGGVSQRWGGGSGRGRGGRKGRPSTPGSERGGGRRRLWRAGGPWPKSKPKVQAGV